MPAGAQIRIRVDQALSTDDTQAGAPFSGRVMLNVMENGSVIIPAGSTMRGRVVQVSQGHHFGPGASLRLRPDVVVLPDGTAYHLDAQVAYSNADGTQVGSEGAVQPSSHVVKKSIEYGATMGTGAIVGAAIAGPPGALAGTLVGAGLVTTHLLLQHPDDASIPARFGHHLQPHRTAVLSSPPGINLVLRPRLRPMGAPSALLFFPHPRVKAESNLLYPITNVVILSKVGRA